MRSLICLFNDVTMDSSDAKDSALHLPSNDEFCLGSNSEFGDFPVEGLELMFKAGNRVFCYVFDFA